MSDLQVTVALSVRNGADFVRAAVESILHQSLKELLLVVVDDASEDATSEVVLPVARSDSRVQLIRMRKHVGTFAAKNLVLRHFARGSFFAHQDADDESTPDRLRRQVTFLLRHSEYGGCGTAIDEFFERTEDAPLVPGGERIRFDAERAVFRRLNRYPEHVSTGAYFTEPLGQLHQIKLAMNGSLMFRTKVLRALGGFDGRTQMAGDTELLWRLLLSYPLANLKEVLYRRRFHAGSMTRSPQLGFQSDLRRTYIEGVRARLIRDSNAGRTACPPQEMYVPEVGFDELS